MTRVDFYQIESKEAPHRFACRLIDKVYRLGHHVYVHTASPAATAAMDELLWTWQSDRFIPHTTQRSGDPAPILISHEDDPADHHEVLINLSGSVPDFFSRFERVAEVVPLDENSRDAARRNYKFYQDRGYPLQYHAMS